MALTIGDNFSYLGAKPLDGRIKYETVAAMAGMGDSTLYDGCIAYCVATDKTYQWKSTNTVDSTLGKWREFETGGSGGDSIQVDTMPTASVSELGKVYQYIGATDATYTHNHFYECVSDGAATPTYSWEEVRVEESETEEILKSDFDALTPAEKNNGKAYFIPDADMVTGFTVMGNRFDKANIYTATERMIGAYMGKPLYQKTYHDVPIPSSGDGERVLIAATDIPANIDRMVGISGVYTPAQAKNQIYPISVDWASSYTFCPRYYNGEISAYIGGWGSAPGQTAIITIRYTKTTDATISIGTENDYSTEEMIVGTWIDGKPIYQKTIIDTMPVTATYGTTVSKNIEIDPSMDKIVHVYAFLIENGTSYRSLPSIDQTDGNVAYARYSIYTNIPNENNVMKLRNSIVSCSNAPVYFTVQYTKTTD